MLERFNDEALRALTIARQEARLLEHNYLGTAHLVLGLVGEGGVVAVTLDEMGISLNELRDLLVAIVGCGSQSVHDPLLTPGAKRTLKGSIREAARLGHDGVGTEHVLLSILRDGESVGLQMLMKAGLDPDRTAYLVIERREHPRTEAPLTYDERKRLAAADRARSGIIPIGSLPGDDFPLRCESCRAEYIAGTVLCANCMGTDLRPSSEL